MREDDRRDRSAESTSDLITHDDRPMWVGEVTDGDLLVTLGDELWRVPVDDVEPSRIPCAGPLPVLDTIDMEQVYLSDGAPRAGAVVTSNVVVELLWQDGQWHLHGFASSGASLPPASEEVLWERDGIDASADERGARV